MGRYHGALCSDTDACVTYNFTLLLIVRGLVHRYKLFISNSICGIVENTRFHKSQKCLHNSIFFITFAPAIGKTTFCLMRRIGPIRPTINYKQFNND